MNDVGPMIKGVFQLLSIVAGLFAALLMVPGLIPLLGALNWLVLVLCVVGVIFGSFPDRKIGLTINLVVGVVAVLRLFLGGGVV